MNFYEALQAFKGSGRWPKIGIRSIEWRKHPTRRFIRADGIDSHCMFGMVYYDFVQQQWLKTWSVFMPTYYEVYEEEWEIVPNEEVHRIHLKGIYMPAHAQGLGVEEEPLIELLTFCKDPKGKKFLEAYARLTKPFEELYKVYKENGKGGP